ncbi:MAG: isoleucine--tRNA ligase [Deltaproteobacteria bacterium]|nr:isoleucine--tRNA ligase [Deltaproteobacteria bacterium]
MEYKQTLNLPKTSFPMRANLPQNEPRQVEKWQNNKTYFKIVAAKEGKQKFILHDGPPYANGNIHLGHALNKILKDIIVKYKSMTGFEAPYIPGWDCHGLPIELQVEKSIGRAKKNSLSKAEVRKLCREYAEKYISIQREEFKRLGILGDWEHPYRTIDFPYEAQEIRELGKLIAAGDLYRQKKPVYWCASCVTALAEAEVEYEDHTSPAIFVKFGVKDPKGKFSPDASNGSYFVIWTTTPWTLPANQAIAVHPELKYKHVKTPAGGLVVAADLIPRLMETFGFRKAQFQVGRQSWTGKELEGIVCQHPWLDRDVKIILGDFVTEDQGSGCVHIAPGHGQEDYEAGQRYNLEVSAPVDPEGKFTKEAGDLAGQFVFKTDRVIIERLEEKGALLKEEQLTHSYPHCWRCKKAVIFRATEQWFVSMEKNQLRQRSLEAIDQVRWIPPWGKERIRGMLEGRPDWCISRQRSWGVPIPVVYCKKCQVPVMNQELCNHVAGIFELEGSDAWFVRSLDQLLPPGFKCAECGGSEFHKEEDILDVWFDSGVSHAAVVERHPALGGRADLYLEGSDQHRGWFHTSLLTSVGTRGKAPYAGALTHGFTLDGAGRKMSKSLGNVIAPQETIKSFGAEILRLWVSAEDYRDDVRISKEILNRLVEAYRKLRNTARFLLGNLYDFDPEEDTIAPKELSELDRWILHRTQQLLSDCRSAYENYEFHTVYHRLNNFCSVDLSALYLDIAKDRLYCGRANSQDRRSAQTALYQILQALVHLMAPILSFTAEEIWEHLPKPKDAPESILMSQIPTPDKSLMDTALGDKWEEIFKIRAEILKALEAARNSGKIGHSLDARVTLFPGMYKKELTGFLGDKNIKWDDVAIVSQLQLLESDPKWKTEDTDKLTAGGSEPLGELAIRYHSPVLGGRIEVSKAATNGNLPKCERCWKYTEDIGTSSDHPTVCGRCSEVLRSEGRS